MREQIYAALLKEIDKTDQLKKRQKRRLKRKLKRSTAFREFVIDQTTIEIIGQDAVDFDGAEPAIDWSSIDWQALLAFVIQIIGLFGA